MARSLLLAAALVASTPLRAQQFQVQTPPTLASASVTPQARSLLERDWVLTNWALKYFDSNHDIMLESGEEAAAADRFRQIADTNHDGRITPEEYRAARALILAQY
jgi:hypothetical protein